MKICEHNGNVGAKFKETELTTVLTTTNIAGRTCANAPNISSNIWLNKCCANVGSV